FGDTLDQGNHALIVAAAGAAGQRGRGARRFPYTSAMPAVPFASRCLYALAWCVGRLPRGLQDRLGRALGSLAWRFDGREPKVARRNLGLALPGLDAGEREALVRDVMRETGRAAFETLRLWTRPRADALSRVAGCVGLGL